MNALLQNESIKVLTHARLIDYMTRRPTHLVARMAENNHVINLCSSAYKNKYQPGVIAENGWQTKCYYKWPLSSNKFVARINNLGYGRFLRRNIAAEDIVWAYEPFTIDAYIDCQRKLLVYEMCDDTSAFFVNDLRKHDETLRQEEKICRSADIVFTISEHLLEKKKHLNENFHVVRNGADFSYFNQALTLAKDPRDELAPLSGPIVGYYGAISPWVDYELIGRTAAALRDVQFVFVGRINPACLKDLDDMKKVSNVYFLGERKYSDLIHYLKYFDVAIIPFKMNQLIQSVNPIKMYEYLAAGKPVLSTPLPEVKKYEEEGVVETAADPDEFAAKIKRLIGLGSAQNLMRKRIALAFENSWDVRYGELQKLVHECLIAKKTRP